MKQIVFCLQSSTKTVLEITKLSYWGPQCKLCKLVAGINSIHGMNVTWHSRSEFKRIWVWFRLWLESNSVVVGMKIYVKKCWSLEFWLFVPKLFWHEFDSKIGHVSMIYVIFSIYYWFRKQYYLRCCYQWRKVRRIALESRGQPLSSD